MGVLIRYLVTMLYAISTSAEDIAQAKVNSAIAVPAAASAAVTIFGVTTGLSYEVLFAGFAGALCSLSFIASLTVWGRVWTLVTSTLFAGYVSPIACLLVPDMVPSIKGVSTLSVFTAYCCGMGAQALLPNLFKWLGNRSNAATSDGAI